MKNKAKELESQFGDDSTEFKIFISDKDKRGNHSVHIYLEGCIDKTFYGVQHFQVESPFGNDAD